MRGPPSPKLPLELRKLARAMHAELKVQRKFVILAPAPAPKHPGHMVRTVVDDAPDWYYRICAQRTSTRLMGNGRSRVRSTIMRHDVFRSLARIAAGKHMRRPDSIDRIVLPVVQAEFDRDRVPF